MTNKTFAYYPALTTEITQYINDSDPKKAILENYPKIREQVKRKDSKILKIIEELEKSSFKPLILKLDVFFSSNYMKYIDGTADIQSLLGTYGKSIRDLYDKNSEDPYFKKLPDLYSLLSNKEMQINKTETLLLHLKKNVKICPICQSKELEYTEADHFLPKSFYPTLSITPANLVPICKVCNSPGVKGDKYVEIPTLHPLFVGRSFFEKHVKVCFQGISEIPLVELLPQNDPKIENFSNLFSIQDRFQKANWLEDFQLKWASLQEETYEDLKERAIRREELKDVVYLELDKQIKKKKRCMERELESHFSYYVSMFDTVDSQTKDCHVYYLVSKIIRHSEEFNFIN